MSDLMLQENPVWNYLLPKKALTKWTKENVVLHYCDDGTVDATFSFIGSTCGNMGHSIYYDFKLKLSSLADGRRLLEAICHPSEKDMGSNRMCAFTADPVHFFSKISQFHLLLGETLEKCMQWDPVTIPAGCLCNVQSRNHKWRNVFQTVHYALSLEEEL